MSKNKNVTDEYCWLHNVKRITPTCTINSNSNTSKKFNLLVNLLVTYLKIYQGVVQQLFNTVYNVYLKNKLYLLKFL